MNSHRWHGITWYYGSKGILEKLRTLRDSTDPDHIIITSQTNKYRRFAIIPLATLPRLLQTNKGILEIIEPHRPRKVYFDIDHTTSSLDEIKTRIQTIFPDAKFAISGNHERHSYHILLTNYHYSNVIDMNDLKEWCKLKDQQDMGFDPIPYSRNQQFKCINQSKPDKPEQLYLDGSTNIKDHIVNYVSDESRNASGLLRREPPSLKDVNISSIPQSNLPIPQVIPHSSGLIDLRLATPYELISLLPNAPRGDSIGLEHSHTLTVMCYAKRNGVPFTDFWNWAKQKDPSESRLAQYLRRWEDPPHWYPKSKDIQNLLERFYPDIGKPKWAIAHRESLLSNQPDITLPDRFMTYEQIPRNRIVALAQGMGANKTGSVIDYLMTGKHEFIWLTPRITLAKNTYGRFPPESGVQYYKDFNRKEKKQMHGQKRLILGAQSLHYLEFADLETIRNKIIVIDEIEFVMSDWMNETHKVWRDTNWKVFLKLIQNCKKCIVMDAFLSNLSLDFLRAISSDLVIVNRTPVPSNVTITELKYKRPKTKSDVPIPPEVAAFISHIADSLKNGKKCFVFYPYKVSTDTRIGIETVRDTILAYAGLSTEESLCYFAESDDSVINGLSTVNEQWSKVKLVITNSKITVGVNYNQSDYDLCYIAKASFNSPREITQVSARIRQLRDNQIYITYLPGLTPKQYETPYSSCPIFNKLKENYAIEFYTKNSREICKVFFGLAGYRIDISQLKTSINRENFEYVRACEATFLWSNIPEITDAQTLESLQNKCYICEATQQDKLTLDKYNFSAQFPDDANPEMLANIWNNRCVTMVLRHILLIKDTHHIIHRAYSDLGISSLTEELWERGRHLSLETKALIFSQYNLDSRIDDSDYVILSKLLSVYYNYKILSYHRDSKSWTVSLLFIEFTQFVEQTVEGLSMPNFLLD